MKNSTSEIKKEKRNKQKGQFMLEGILLIILFAGVATVLKNKMTEKNVLGSLVAGPWKQIAGMMSNGVWKEESQGVSYHPLANPASREGDP